MCSNKFFLFILMFQQSEYTFQIPNGEVTLEWHRWVKKYLGANEIPSFSGVYETIIGVNAEIFQKQFTTFLQEYLALYCMPHHKEKVYQALCYMLIFTLFGKEYDIKMEQDAGHGRSDITAHPFSPQQKLALIFEINLVAHHLMRNRKRSLKTAQCIDKDLENTKTEGLAQLADRCYRKRVPCHAISVHKFVFVFYGKLCVAAMCTLEHNIMEDWEQVTADSTVVSQCTVDHKDMGKEDVGDEDEEA
jgi:hypothetical protein